MTADRRVNPPLPRGQKPPRHLRWYVPLLLLAMMLLATACADSGGGGGKGSGGGLAGPTADAGADQTVAKRVTVTLNGGASSGATSYSWTQTAGTAVTLSNPTAAVTTFTSPGTSGVLQFQLTVNNAASDSVAVTVTNTAPTATAAVHLDSTQGKYHRGETILLEVTAADADSDGLTYTWDQPGGTTAVMHNIHSPTPVIVIPAPAGTFAVPEILTFRVIVSDGDTGSVTSTVNVDAVPYTGAAASLTTTPSTPFRTEYTALTLARGVSYQTPNLYVADSTSGMRVFGVNSSTGALTLLATLTPPSTNAMGIAAVGTNAYLADGANGLRVIDITTPASPTLTSTFNGGFTFDDWQKVAVSGSTVYAAAGTYGLIRVNVSTPSTPSLIGGAPYPTPNAVDVAVNANIVYVADATDGLYILDFTKTPELQKLYVPAGGKPKGVTLGSPGQIFLALGTGGVELVDVNIPTAPVKVKSFDTLGDAQSVAIDNSYHAYVADDSGLQVIDFSGSAATAPTWIGRYVLPRSTTVPAIPGALGVAVDPITRFCFVAGVNGITNFVFKVNDPTLSSVMANLTTPQFAWGIAAEGETGYTGRLTELDLTVPPLRSSRLVPSIAQTVTPSGTGGGRGIALSNGYAYLAGGTAGFEIISVRDSSNIARVGSYTTGYSSVAPANDVALTGTTAVVAGGTTSGTLSVFNVATPAAPTLVASKSAGISLTDVAITTIGATPYAFAADSGAATLPGLYRFDLSSTSLTQQQYTRGGALTGYPAYGVAANGSTVYAALGAKGLEVIDGNAMTQITNFAVPGSVKDVALAGNYAYLLVEPASGEKQFNFSIVILDIAAPATPVVAGRYEAGLLAARRIAYEGGVIYLTDVNSGLLAAEATPYVGRADSATAGSTVNYSVSWRGTSVSANTSVTCFVTIGNCALVGTPDQTNHAASLNWDTTGAAPGDYEIVIAVGNEHYFITAKDRITVP